MLFIRKKSKRINFHDVIQHLTSPEVLILFNIERYSVEIVSFS